LCRGAVTKQPRFLPLEAAVRRARRGAHPPPARCADWSNLDRTWKHSVAREDRARKQACDASVAVGERRRRL